jgi:hypothetical protein
MTVPKHRHSNSSRVHHRRPWGARWRTLGALALALYVMSGHAALPTRPSVSKEYQLKAAFLYNFTKFVDWPPQHFATEHEPITIAILGANPFGAELEMIVKERRVNGREIAITTGASMADIEGADMVFFARDVEDDKLNGLVEKLHGAGVLTIGDSSRFRQEGVVILFVFEGDKVRFEIDMEAAERSQVKISAQLQKLAKTLRRTP